MIVKEENIRALTLTFEPKDFINQTDEDLVKFMEVVKSSYIYRINVPVESYSAYYASETYKALRDNTDKKTKMKFYIIETKMNGSKEEKVKFYFDSPSTH